MVIEAAEPEPIEFKSSVVAVDTGTLVIGLFDGDPAACIAILTARPPAARSLMMQLGSTLDLVE